MECPITDYVPPAIESKSKLTFDLLLETEKSNKTSLDLSAPIVKREFVQESNNVSLDTSIQYQEKQRQYVVRDTAPSSDIEVVYLDIARLSRQLDHLTFLNATIDAFLDQTKLSKLNSHPLHDKKCFTKNKGEFATLNKILENN
jgi:hypothetical protein